jgi:hypothetical protein
MDAARVKPMTRLKVLWVSGASKPSGLTGYAFFSISTILIS